MTRPPVRTPEEVAERKAAALADAAVLGDQAAADKHGIKVRTLRRYRTHARRDGGLLARAAFGKVEQSQREWLPVAQAALVEMTDALQAAVTRMLSRKNLRPEDVHAAAGALKIVSDAMDSRLHLQFLVQTSVDQKALKGETTCVTEVP